MQENNKELLIMANLNHNNNKFWIGWVDEFGGFYCRYGRVGSNGASADKVFRTKSQAENNLHKKVREKIKKGYKLAPYIISDIETKTNLPIEQIALSQIKTNDETGQISELITRLSRENIHSILEKTDLSYDEETGMFKTELGFITKDAITEARKVLDGLAKHVEMNTHKTSEDAKNLLADYLMIVPQKVKVLRSVESVIGSIDDIHSQHEILDDLEVSASEIGNKKVNNIQLSIEDYPSIFNSSLNIVSDKKIISEIEKMFSSTKNSIHRSSHFRVSRVFSVDINKMTNSFDEKGKVFGNIKRLWHGTRASNIISILKSGLIIPPSRSGHVTGRMFGDGLYFSDQSTKSLNYSTGFWNGGSSKNNCYMFVCDVAMGNSYIPECSNYDLHNEGHDSVYAIGGKSGVMNNEMIVYSTSQAVPRYLVEFTS